MKIKIKSEGKNINLVFPTRLLVNRFTASIGAEVINENSGSGDMEINAKDLQKLFNEINRIKRKYPKLVLVDVESANGDIVKITL